MKRGVKPTIKQGKKEVSTTLLYNRFCFLVSKEKEELEFCLCSFSYIVDRESKRNISSIASFFYHKRRKLSAMPSIYRGTLLVIFLLPCQ